jgi:cell wall-associated NlpC family hydrolase
MTDMSLVRDYAMRFIGVPYHYGGASPMEGEDCSHFVCEMLMAFGIEPFGFYLTAQGLSEQAHRTESPYQHLGTSDSIEMGDLAFFGKGPNQVEHVGFCLNDSLMINAAGGDASTVNVAEAIKHQAFVKIRPIHYRRDFLFVVRPKWGV